VAQRRTGVSGISSTLGLLGWVGATAIAAAIGSMAVASSQAFYEALQRPTWAPPGSVFRPVWTVLYLAMAVGAWMVWQARDYVGARVALIMFVVQLALGVLWAWLFFAWHQGALAFLDFAREMAARADARNVPA